MISTQTNVIMAPHINQLQPGWGAIWEAAIEGAGRRPRPMMLTAAGCQAEPAAGLSLTSIRLLPALSHDIASHSQRPFAIGIGNGLGLGRPIAGRTRCRAQQQPRRRGTVDQGFRAGPDEEDSDERGAACGGCEITARRKGNV
jgi:hypothetical protein